MDPSWISVPLFVAIITVFEVKGIQLSIMTGGTRNRIRTFFLSLVKTLFFH